ncbi:7846_t:CDS:1, partial [Cetraspora pellucida]
MANISISVILDKKAKSQKLNNNRPEYDIKYVNSYILNYYDINDYQQFFEKLFETERQYDILSVIQPNETLQQWAFRVRISLQKLVSKRKRSVYHVYALFLVFGK